VAYEFEEEASRQVANAKKRIEFSIDNAPTPTVVID
jgi:hypothetical protein